MKRLSERNTKVNENIYLDNKDKDKLISMLKNALKEEFNAWYGYLITKDFLTGPERVSIAKFYEDTAKDELEDHGYWLIKRINELGGDLEDIAMSPNSWADAVHKYIAPVWKDKNIDVKKSLEDNIKNEEGAIATYQELEEYSRELDPVTNSKIKEILGDEEEHLTELMELLNDIK